MTGGDLVTKADLAVLEKKLDLALDLLAELRQSLPVRWLTVGEAARHLHCQPATARQMAKRGDLRSRRVGRKILIDASSLRGPTAEEIAQAAREARS